MGEDDVLQHHERIGRETDALLAYEAVSLVAEHEDPLDDVAHKLAAVGVRERLVVGELAGLAQVVEEQPHHDQVAVDLRVERADAIGEV
jgi:hypothetical protein